MKLEKASDMIPAMKIESAVCVVHRESALLTEQSGPFRIGESTIVGAHKCEESDCHTSYAPLHGYFYLRPGVMFKKLTWNLACEKDHERRTVHLYLKERADNSLVWACPECSLTKEYTGMTGFADDAESLMIFGSATGR